MNLKQEEKDHLLNMKDLGLQVADAVERKWVNILKAKYWGALISQLDMLVLRRLLKLINLHHKRMELTFLDLYHKLD